MITVHVTRTINNKTHHRLEQILGQLHSVDRFLYEAADIAADNYAARVPVESGLLKEKIQTKTRVMKDPDGKSIGVAPFYEIGAKRRGRGRGTIARFLRDYPQFKARRYIPMLDRSDGLYAWWALPSMAKTILDQDRESGRYGGSQLGKIVPLYWPAQEEGTYPAPGGAVAKNFVDRANAEIVIAVDTLAMKYFTGL